MQAQQAAAEEEFERQKILAQQQQEHERQMAAANAQSDALIELYRNPAARARFSSIDPDTRFLELMEVNYNAPYDTNNATDPSFSPVDPTKLKKKYPKLTKGKFQ